MGRRKPAWQQRREADIAQAREQYYATRTRTTSTTVTPRRMDKAVYMSTNILRGATNALFNVPISEAAKTFFGGLVTLGLQDPATVTDPVSSEPRGVFTPSKLIAMVGATTPTAHTTPWGSRVIKYSAATTGTGQAHYTAPFSTGTTAPTANTLDAKANQIFTAVSAQLNASDYSNFYWLPERASFSKAG